MKNGGFLFLIIQESLKLGEKKTVVEKLVDKVFWYRQGKLNNWMDIFLNRCSSTGFNRDCLFVRR